MPEAMLPLDDRSGKAHPQRVRRAVQPDCNDILWDHAPKLYRKQRTAKVCEASQLEHTHTTKNLKRN